VDGHWRVLIHWGLFRWCFFFKSRLYVFLPPKEANPLHSFVLQVRVSKYKWSTQRKSVVYFEGTLISVNFPPWKWEGCYAYSSVVGGKLCLLQGVRTLPLLRSAHNVPPTPTPHDLHRFGGFMINFSLCFMIGKAHGWRTFSKCGVGLGYCLVLGPLFWECPHRRALPYTKCHVAGP